MGKKIAFIVPYFGQLPNYFSLFLDSCSYNTGFDWLIFSDDSTEYNYPSNVHLIKMNFQQCKELVQSKFDFKIILHTPQKLCDYKCAYGYIFSDYLKKYDWWGHCDLDQVFGDLGSFLSEEMLEKYEKIGSIGHLTLYKNTTENNRMFMSTNRYREVFTTTKGCGFDEWLPGNINEIYQNSDRLVFLDNIGADIDPYKMTFQTVHFDIGNQIYNRSAIKNSIFRVEKGKLYQLYTSKNGVEKIEYPYVHLQKRKMKVDRKEKDAYYIVPNRFVDATESEKKLLRKASIWRLLNIQFFRVKIKSLRYRIKSGDWEFTSVFRKNRGEK